MFTNFDYMILVFWFIFAAFFTFVAGDKVYKFYFWVIIGFLLFQLVNQDITILWINPTGKTFSWYENFIQKNSDFMLTMFTILIPLLGIFFTINSSLQIHVRGNIFWYVSFGFMLPFFLLWISTYILVNASTHLVFLQDILKPISSSFFYNFFYWHLHYVFIFIFIFLFYRIMWEIFFKLFLNASANIIGKLKEQFWKKSEHVWWHWDHEEDEHWHEEHHDDHHSDHGLHDDHHGHKGWHWHH